MPDAGTTAASDVEHVPWLQAHEYRAWSGDHYAFEALPPGQHYGISGAKAALLDHNTVAVVGGRACPTDRWATAARVDLFDLSTSRWRSAVDIDGSFSRRVGHSVVRVQDAVVVFGGEPLDVTETADGRKAHALDDCYALTLTENVLSCRPLAIDSNAVAPGERAWHGAVAVSHLGSSERCANGAMLLLGGRDGSGRFLSDCWGLSLSTRQEGSSNQPEHASLVPQWVALQPTGNSPLPLAYHSVVAVDDGAVVLVLALSGLRHGLLARCCHTAVALQLPVQEDEQGHRRLVEILHDDESKDKEPAPRHTMVLVFGGFSERDAVLPATQLVLLDRERLTARELTAPSIGIRSFMAHAAVTTQDAQSLLVFGGVAPKTHEWLDATSALHFWRPQPNASGAQRALDDDDDSAERVKTMANGDVYTGQLQASTGHRHGRGRCVYHNDGGEYDGEWRADQRSGQGVMRYPSGDTYAGQWAADMRHGFGILQCSALKTTTTTAAKRVELRYDGQWHEDLRHGRGVATFSDGARLDAEWVRGELMRSGRLENYDDGHGVGTFVGDVAAVLGVPHGHGESQYPNGVSYVGAWLHGRRSGHGVETLADGSTYRGEWRNGKRNGFGTSVDARTRDEYEGKWVGGVRCGRGVCRYANGSAYDGEWKDGRCHGHGRFTFADGTFYEGDWRENHFCGDGALRERHQQQEQEQ
ncbi:hypothetical protein PINS_up003078 [Pythium insidiosum]|nr:hypothetical protein PINS_up003078 [Pythium insidiosum]